MSRDQELEDMLTKVRESLPSTDELQIRRWQSAVEKHRLSNRNENKRMRDMIAAVVIGMIVGASLYKTIESFNKDTLPTPQYSATVEHVYVNSN